MSRVVVELVVMSVSSGRLQWRVVEEPMGRRDRADDVALRLSRPSPLGDVVLHSTSWRHRRREVVLTYALFPGAGSASSQDVQHHLVTGPDAVHPSPVLVEGAHVAAHAVRHLADLASGRDPHVTGCADRDPLQWGLLTGLAARVHPQHQATDAEQREPEPAHRR